GGGALDWSVAAGASWLVLTPFSGKSTGQACTTTVVVNTAGLTAGTYSASITISAPGAANSPMTAPVTLAVVSTTTPPAPAPPTIGYSPANVVFAATQGGSNPSAQSLGVWNSGGGTLNWSVSDDAPWLALSPASGSSTGETDPVSVSVNITGLAAGTYTAMVSIWASGATNSPRYMGVVLTVAASTAPSLGQAVDNLALAWATGGHGNWLGQRGTSFYGGSAAQSGRIGNNQSTWMKTTVTGPGTVSFYWSVSSENRCDFLRFLVEGTERDFISGSLSWRQCSYGIASGTHVLEWRYTKDLSVSISGDCGWVDKVQFAPNTSTILERRVTGSTDDGYVTLKGGVPAGFSSMETLVFAGQRLGASYDIFLRFTDIRVPKGATIRKAYMMLYLNNLDIPPWLNVYVEDSPNPSNVGSPGDYLGRAVSGGGDYFFSPGSKGWKQTPDISPLIQGLVNKWDYSGGAAMQVFLKNVGDSSTFISFFSAYEHLVDHSDAAVLHIEFDPPR
ncbi:MAG: hypothetical protein Q7T05_06900, partial [Dehalococcoidia bacterium]|nr:hypothetical protein [Dehalococcoidia bacterium]